MEVSQKRQVARKVRIKDLIQGKYIRIEGEWEPNFIQTVDGRTFSRVNLISVVASEPVPDVNFNTFIIDDGSGRVPVRVFGEQSKKIKVQLGEIILLIGRPREFNQQVYIVPEIVKKIEDKTWIDLRRLELELLQKQIVEAPEKIHEERAAQQPANVEIKVPETIIEEGPAVMNQSEKEATIEKDPVETKEPEPTIEKAPVEAKEPASEQATVEDKAPEETPEQTGDNPIDHLIDTIKKLDQGDGADTEEVISASKVGNAESILDNLLKEGEIFEVRSGKIKVLE